MAHFAELDESNNVVRVIVVNNEELLIDGVESEAKGVEFCSNLFGGIWLQTSYNSNIRYNFAGVGYIYDPIDDAFIPPMPECGHVELELNELKQWNCTNQEHGIYE